MYSLCFEPIAQHILDKYFNHRATATSSTPTFFVLVEMDLAELFRMNSFSRPGSSWTSHLLSSAFWVAGMTGLSPQAQQWFLVLSSQFWFCNLPHHANTRLSTLSHDTSLHPLFCLSSQPVFSQQCHWTHSIKNKQTTNKQKPSCAFLLLLLPLELFSYFESWLHFLCTFC